MALATMKAKNTVESLREIVQDLLVPELKALKVEVTSVHSEMTSSLTSLRGEMTSGFEALRTEMRLRDEKQSQAIQALSDKLGYAIDIQARLAVLEDRGTRT